MLLGVLARYTLIIRIYFVEVASLLIYHAFGIIPLPVTSSFAVEALSLRLRSRLGFLLLSSNLFAVLLEVPFLSLALFLKLVVLSIINTLMLFLDFYLRRF